MDDDFDSKSPPGLNIMKNDPANASQNSVNLQKTSPPNIPSLKKTPIHVSQNEYLSISAASGNDSASKLAPRLNIQLLKPAKATQTPLVVNLLETSLPLFSARPRKSASEYRAVFEALAPGLNIMKNDAPQTPLNSPPRSEFLAILEARKKDPSPMANNTAQMSCLGDGESEGDAESEGGDEYKGDKRSGESEGDYTGVDRFSDLVVSLKVRILSCLGMKEAVRTSILSKSWLGVWNGIYRVMYEFDSFDDKDLAGFIAFVSGSLRVLDSPKLEVFSLVINHKDFSPNPVVDHWLSSIVKKKPDILNLEFRWTDYGVPDWFYDNPYVLDMNIRLCNYEGQPVQWRSLQKLHLSCISFSDQQIATILLGCPGLHTLVLSEVAISVIAIKNNSIKHLTLLDLKLHETSDFVLIIAPFLTTLEILGSSFEPHCSLTDASSLDSVVLDYTPQQYEGVGNEWIRVARMLIRDVKAATSVTLGPFFIKILSILSFKQPICLSKCMNAKLSSHFFAHDLPGITSFLSHSSVDTLCVRVVAPHCEHFVNNVYGFRSLSFIKDGDAILDLFEGRLSHLTTIMLYFERKPSVNDKTKSFEFEFVRYLVRNAAGLKKLVIASKSANDFKAVSSFTERLVHVNLGGKCKWDLKKKKSSFEFYFC